MLRVARFLPAAFAVCLTSGMGLLPGQDEDIFAQCRSGAVGGGDLGGPFTLVSETGETVTDADVISEPSLLYFGYTFCPDVCPFDTVRNAEAVEILERDGILVQPVFISVDPERDTPEMMADFTSNIHPRMLGLTGTPEQVEVAKRAYRAYAARTETEDGDDFYLIDHSTFSYLVLPDHGFVEFYRRDATPEDMAASMACFVAAAAALH